jgi:hypothetical protein
MMEARRGGNLARALPSPDPGRPVLATPFIWVAPESIPPRKWLFGRHAIRQFLSATIAASGAGKTSNALAEAVAFVTGRDILKDHLITSGRSWYIGLEDPLEEYQRRVAAIVLHHGLTPTEVAAGLFLDSGRDQDFIIGREGRSGIIIADPLVESIVQCIRTNNIAHVTIDPFVACHAVRENDNTAIDAVARVWADIADRTGAAIELVHHVRKLAPGQEMTADDARGASAMVGKARSVRLVTGMTKEEAEQAGADDRRRFFRLVNGKANLALQSEKPIWRQLVSVSLGNGQGGPDDYVQAAAPWTWPDAFAGLTSTDLQRVQDRIAAGEYRANPQANDWAGYAVAEVLHLDIATKAGKHKVKRLLDTCVRIGALRQEKRPDSTRQERPFIVVGNRT